MPDPQLRDALAMLTKKIDDAYIKGDAAALAALYTEDATLLRLLEDLEDAWRGRRFSRKAVGCTADLPHFSP